MDKQKDFIHIDDVFRDLRQAEEKEKTGAWLQMKDLLDKELPVGSSFPRPGGYRRYLLPIVAALLLGGGAYYIHRQSEQANRQTPADTIHQHQISSVNDENADNSITNNLRTINKSSVTQKQAQHNTANTLTTARKNITATTNKENKTPKNPEYHHRTTSRTSIAAALPVGTEKEHTTSPAGTGNGPQSAFSKTSTTRNLPIGSIQQQKITALSDEPPVIRENHIIETLKPKPAPETLKSTGDNNIASESNSPTGKEWKPLATWKGTPIVSSKNNHLYKEERDTFTAMTITRKLPAKPGPDYRDRIQLDTVSISRIESIRYVPLSLDERMELMHANLLPASYWAALMPHSAMASASRTEQVNIVPLSAYKVSSKKAKTNTLGTLKNTATGLTSVFDGTKKWYAAILLGGNTSIGNPSAYGMQLGVAALFAFAERWTLSAELKYQNGYFSNFQFLDNASTFEVDEQQYGGGWLYQGKEYKTSNNYTIKSKANLNMPILLSYNLGRISVFGGPEFSYFYPLKWGKGQHTEITNVSQATPTHTNPFVNSTLLLNEQTDFNSRFALGYVLGLSYDFSRKVSLDARVSQMLWDNSGKYKMDALRNIYHLPTAELSIGFYFGRRDKVIYILDRKK